jgi:hypothetical protein
MVSFVHLTAVRLNDSLKGGLIQDYLLLMLLFIRVTSHNCRIYSIPLFLPFFFLRQLSQRWTPDLIGGDLDSLLSTTRAAVEGVLIECNLAPKVKDLDNALTAIAAMDSPFCWMQHSDQWSRRFQSKNTWVQDPRRDVCSPKY